ncbi:MAG TPA: hypothetical protein VGN26_12760 [Armatimonadota bacterium]|jgi:hypothetical protein
MGRKVAVTAAALWALAAVAALSVGGIMAGKGAEALPAVAVQADAATDLDRAVAAFNDKAKADPVGKGQQVLTAAEVISSLRWLLVSRDPKEASPEEYATLERIVKEKRLVGGATLEVQPDYEPNDRAAFTVWSVRLVLPRANGTHAIILREQFVSSREIGPKERAVIRKWNELWRKQGGIASFDRVPYSRERQKAAEEDSREGGS